MQHATFSVHPYSRVETALNELLSQGLEHHYFIEEDSSCLIGGFFKDLPNQLTHSIMHLKPSEIDWDEQWAMHSPYYKDGLLKINLNDFGASLEDPFIYLQPGPGFGDLSHPTTCLMIKNMVNHVSGKSVLDIGCGSGILSIAAKKLGAINVIGLDIDEDALRHAQDNALLNHMSDIPFLKNISDGSIDSNPCILLNMTFQEQLSVFASYPHLCGLFIISGILDNQKVRYKNLFPYPHSTIVYNSFDQWCSFVIK